MRHILRFQLGFLIFCLLAATPLWGQSPDDVERSTVEVDNLLQQAQQSTSDSEQEALAKQCLTLARSLRYDGAVVRASMLLGDQYARTGKNEEALQHYLEAESKTNSSANKSVLVSIYTALGDLFFREKLYQSARRYYAEVLKLQPEDYTTMEKRADVFLADIGLADSIRMKMRFDTAEAHYNVLISKFRSEGNNPRLVQIYQKLAQAYDQVGNTKKSLANYLIIADLIERFGNYQEQALLYNNLGRQYTSLHAYETALRYFRLAEDRCAYINCDYPEVLWANIGIALHNTGDSKQGIVYLQKALAILAARKDQVALANLEHLLAGVYLSSNDTYNALIHNDIAIQLAQQTKQPTVLANAYRTAADAYQDLYDFEKAFDYYREYLNVLDSIRVTEQIRQQRLSQQRGLLAAAEGQIRYLITRQNFKDLEIQQGQYEQERLKLINEKLALEIRQSEDKALLLAKQNEVDQSKIKAQELEAFRARQELRLIAQNLASEKQARLNIDLRRQVEIDRAHSLADSTRNAQENEILRRDKDLSEQRLRAKERLQQYSYWLGSLLLFILVLLGVGFLLARRAGRRLREQNSQIQAQNIEIQEERRKSDRLLTNILPEEIADELKAHGYALPRMYESATVIFTDFVNFTKSSSLLSPEQIIDELNDCFLAFDEICDQHGLEKIKTIGDAFMCAGGLPIPNKTHPQDAVHAALKMLAWLNNRSKTNPRALLRDMRIGIHTGPVVAGVIGKNKFAFDIWGDAVNLAARLEEHGVAGRVNISKSTADAVKDQFIITYRGQEEVHNKGMVEMYFADLK